MIDENFSKAIQEVNQLMIQNPLALTLELRNDEATQKHYYGYADNSSKAQSLRKEARKILVTLYQGGAYSYADFSKYLRVTDLDIKGLIDSQFMAAQGLMPQAEFDSLVQEVLHPKVK